MVNTPAVVIANTSDFRRSSFTEKKESDFHCWYFYKITFAAQNFSMKTTKYLTAIIILTISIVLSSCSDKSKLLVKTWAVENLKYSREIPAEMQPQIERSIEELRHTFLLTYNADGTYKTENSGQILNGKWKLNWNSTTITSTSDKGETKDFKIVELSENKFVFKATEGGEVVTFEMVPAK